ncbi:MAG: SpoVR family protein [Bacillota bacterium]
MEYTINELESWSSKIEKKSQEYGLDCYEQEFELVGYQDMLAYEAYVGMPSRYPHWSFGKAFEKQKTLYRLNLTGLPYEMVINSDPCLAYLMKENTLLLQILTIAHVYGHNDFFKNNRMFREGTKADDTLEMFKRHADIIRSYINDPSIGYESVERVLNAAHSIKLQISRVIGEKKVDSDVLKDSMIAEYIRKSEGHSILDPYVKPELPNIYKLPLQPEEDILYFIMKYSDMQEWEKNILEIVREETAYFIPQIETKIMNEGWASYWHYNILKELELSDNLYMEFIKRHNDVIAPLRESLNPYYLGFRLFEDIEKRYGRDKIFEVRLIERDESFIRRYLTEELCRELNLFEYIKSGNDYVIDEVADEAGWQKIRNTICSSCGMGMVPLIQVKEMLKKDKTLLLEHIFDGRELRMDYAEFTMRYISELWGHRVMLETRMEDRTVMIICDENKKVSIE